MGLSNRNTIKDVSIVSGVGVQLTYHGTEPNNLPTPATHRSDSPLFSFFEQFAKKRFADITEIQNLKLVSIDVLDHEFQFSFK